MKEAHTLIKDFLESNSAEKLDWSRLRRIIAGLQNLESSTAEFEEKLTELIDVIHEKEARELGGASKELAKRQEKRRPETERGLRALLMIAPLHTVHTQAYILSHLGNFICPRNGEYGEREGVIAEENKGGIT